MKKIFTIMLVAAGTIGFASAQSNKSVAFNDNTKMGGYNQQGNFGKTNSVAFKDAYFFNKEKTAKLEKINREFDMKISFVKNDRYLRSWQKAKQIQLLQIERKNEISKVEFQYAVNQRADSKMYGHDSHKW